MKRRDPQTTLGGLDLLEQAVHALRLASPSTLLCYYAGSAPFVLAALFFWSDMSRSGLAEQHLVGGAIGLSALFIWMKVWQSVFALKLSAQVANEAPQKISASTLLCAIGSQTLIHATGLFVIPIAANLLVPTVWVFGFYQNVTVLGLREPSAAALARRSWKQAHWGVGAGHLALVALSCFGIFVFLDIGIAMLGAPYFLKTLAGVETSFTLSAASTVNTTFLAAALGVTYLCVDPLIKAVHVLRCFYGESRATGEDLRVTLRGFRAPVVTALIFLVALATPLPTSAAEKAELQPLASERGAELDHSIDQVLQRPEYTWREPRAKHAAKANDAAESPFWKRFREWAKTTAKNFRDWLDRISKQSSSRVTTPGRFAFSTHGFIYLLIGLVLAIIGVLLWLLWRTRSRAAHAATTATPARPVPDLTRDDVTGEELPVDGWTRLALELLERGELRLAMRAFYLSSLAHLAERSLVSLAEFKSNRDYERELLRHSHALPALSANFSENVSVFDRVWYGRHSIDAELIQHFRGNAERIREC